MTDRLVYKEVIYIKCITFITTHPIHYHKKNHNRAKCSKAAG